MRNTPSRDEIRDRVAIRAALFRLVRIVVLAGFALWATGTHGAELATNAHATIVSAPLHLKAKKDLRFGTIEDCQKSAGTITIGTDGARTISHGLKVDRHDAYGPATFLIKGAADAGYVIGLPGNVTAERQGLGWQFTALNLPGMNLAGLHLPLLQGHGPPLQVVNLTVLTRTPPPPLTDLLAKLDAGGEDLVKVGGTLIVPKNAKPGYYSAEIALSVTYQ
jgi:hypothetical protein